ncbi:hypothetical protein ACP275_03G034000 [Erythranthe tilingii]
MVRILRIEAKWMKLKRGEANCNKVWYFWTSLWRTTPRLIICSLTPTWGQNNNFCWRTAQRLIIWSLSPTWGQNSNFRFHHLPSSACSSFLLSYPSLGAFV